MYLPIPVDFSHISFYVCLGKVSHSNPKAYLPHNTHLWQIRYFPGSKSEILTTEASFGIKELFFQMPL